MSLNGTLSESKSSLPPPTPQKLPPRLPSAYALPDYGKPPISPTKSPNRVTLIENGELAILKVMSFHTLFELLSLILNDSATILKSSEAFIKLKVKSS